MEARLFGLTLTECRQLAFQLADQNRIEHPFNQDRKMAGQGWMQGFLNRHKDLSIRKPEATSGARAMGFNKVAVQQFFKLLEETVQKYKLTAEKNYNVDETGVTVNPKGSSKIIASKGKRQVGVLASAERGETITAEICFSASGACMPPMLIFPRKRMQQGFLDGLVPGGWVELNEKGWIDKILFFSWFKKFVEYSRASKDSPILLLLDGHSSHTKNLDVINYARENGVQMICFPPHCTHRLQALDVAFMKPLSAYYDDEVRKWLRTNPGRVVTFQKISYLFRAAYLRAATMAPKQLEHGQKKQSRGSVPGHPSKFVVVGPRATNQIT
uniref:DDE-1 domain-containing protein n=1 Tax=Photinus pyralis TaxID=7054 RepID=A0A1Y1NM29_PHOPY